MKIIIVIAAALMLTACQTNKALVKPEAVVVVKPAERTPPADAMQACPSLGELDGATFGDVVRKLGDASEKYKQCEQKRKELEDWIKSGLTPEKK